jgi:alpha-amylase
MPSVCIYFQVHQPYRLRRYSFFDIGSLHVYEDEENNRQILNKIAEKCYLPANALLGELIEEYRGDFRIAFSLTGIILEQMERYRPDVLDSFRRLADTGCVEFLSETHYHSLAFLFSLREFKEQVMLHKKKIRDLFGRRPVTFRNTELIYSNELAKLAEEMGYQVVLAEGADKILSGRSPNFVYRPAGCEKIKLLLKNYRLSDDIAFRFSNPRWSEYPLMADKFAHWLHQINNHGDVINLFMDYETFGEHQWQETGILNFLRSLPREITRHPDFFFQTPAEVALNNEPVSPLDVPYPISWADTERDLTAWLGNALQKDAIRALYDLEMMVRRQKDPGLLHTWRTLQTSDHFYYMCTKWFADGDVHKYFNPYESPYDACINYMNILEDFTRLLPGGSSRKARREGKKITAVKGEFIP